jgi:hypothetical protein
MCNFLFYDEEVLYYGHTERGQGVLLNTDPGRPRADQKCMFLYFLRKIIALLMFLGKQYVFASTPGKFGLSLKESLLRKIVVLKAIIE